MPDMNRRLAAILSADAMGYSRLMSRNEAATVRTLQGHRQVMTSLIEQHHGRVVDAPGDNLLAEFASVVDAVQAAVAVQRELGFRNRKLPVRERMHFRIGINLGDIIANGQSIYGDGVNIAARLEGMADPGGICISRTAYDQIEDKLPLGYEYLGEKRLKNIARPVPAFRVILEPRPLSWFKRRRRRSQAPAPSPAPSADAVMVASGKKRLLCLVLCLPFGIFGAHRFYVGKTYSARWQLCTVGGAGLWFLADLVLILFGKFRDAQRRPVINWI